MKRRDPDEYAEIRIMLQEMRPYLDQVNPHVRVMGEDVYLDLWTYYDVATLGARHGDKWWTTLVDMWDAPGWEIWGRQEGGEWEPISGWLLDNLRRKQWEGEALRAEKRGAAGCAPGEPGRPAGLGVGVLVRHIREVEGIKNYDLVLSVLDESGVGAAQSWLEHWGVEARRRIVELNAENIKTHASSCPYCQGRAMPSRLREAIDRGKSPSN